MRTLAITQNITLDGAIEMLGDWFDPQGAGSALAGSDVSDLQEATRELSARGDALLLGRQTFEDFRGFWPHQTDDTTGITDELNRVQKYVVTSTLTDPDWQNSTILDGDVEEEVRALKAAEGRGITVTGSITLTHALLRAGLVDVLNLFTYPVVQGAGRKLFPDGFSVDRLRLQDSRSFVSGVALTSYALQA